MAKNEIAVLDFGSSKISVYVAEKNVNDFFVIKSIGTCEYAGFMDGEFIEPENLENAIKCAINDAELSLPKKIKKLNIGVPTQFCICETREIGINFNTRVKIKQSHIDKLFESDNENSFAESHSVINKSPLYFMLDDGSKILDPIGAYSTKLFVNESVIYAENKFINFLDKKLTNIGIFDYNLYSCDLSEANYLIDASSRQEGAYLVDCGYINTSAVSVLGEGVVNLNCFSIGGGHITSDLSEVLGISFGSAEELKRQINLNIDAIQSDFYVVKVKNENKAFSVKKVNDIVLARLDMLAEVLKSVFENFEKKIKINSSVYLTGGGISYIRGAKEYLSRVVGKNFKVVMPKPVQLKKPELSSVISLLYVAGNN